MSGGLTGDLLCVISAPKSTLCDLCVFCICDGGGGAAAAAENNRKNRSSLYSQN